MDDFDFLSSSSSTAPANSTTLPTQLDDFLGDFSANVNQDTTTSSGFNDGGLFEMNPTETNDDENLDGDILLSKDVNQQLDDENFTQLVDSDSVQSAFEDQLTVDNNETAASQQDPFWQSEATPSNDPPVVSTETLFEQQKSDTAIDPLAASKEDSFDLVEPEQSNRSIPQSDETLSTPSVNLSEEPPVDEITARVENIKRRIEEEIAKRDASEAVRKEELRQQAKTDLERWYQERERRMNENRQKMKNEEDILRTTALEKSEKETCDWAKVIRLLEFSPGTQLSKTKRDLSRMKASIINAKRQAETKKNTNES